ncbi:MAG: hypothetical protein ABL308_00700 [Oceanicaulis sp.]
MKTFILALLTGAGALGAVALADPPSAPPTFEPEAPGLCQLSFHRDTVLASAASVNAAEWFLSVRAPGMRAEQSGPLYGDTVQLDPLSRIVVRHDAPLGDHPGARGPGGARGDGPIRAALELRDLDGRVVCTDSLFVAPDQGAARRR